jgi:hypothetical protein
VHAQELKKCVLRRGKGEWKQMVGVAEESGWFQGVQITDAQRVKEQDEMLNQLNTWTVKASEMTGGGQRDGELISLFLLNYREVTLQPVEKSIKRSSLSGKSGHAHG